MAMRWNVEVGVGVLRRCEEVVLRCSCAGHGARRRRSQSATAIYCFIIRSLIVLELLKVSFTGTSRVTM